MGDDRQVDLKTDGVCLYPCHISPGNFKKDRDGKVIALDFCATCFFALVFSLLLDGEAGKWVRSERGPVHDLPAVEQCRSDGSRLWLPGSPR